MYGLTPFGRRNRGIGFPADSDDFFGNFMRDALAPIYFGGPHQMRVDIRETDDAYILEADLPGVTKDQISMEVREDELVISVNVDEKRETKQEGYIYRERRSGRMMRSFPLANIDAEKIAGKLENGTLSVTLPKKDKGQPKGRRIDIE